MAMTSASERATPPTRLVLRGGVLADGRPADVAVEPAAGTITEVGQVAARSGDLVEPCGGMVVVPSAVEVHGHLDKALSGDTTAMPVDLAAAVADWMRLAPTLDEAGFTRRATLALEAMVARGYTAVRTHVDLAPDLGLRGVDGLVAARDAVHRRGLAEVQLVALTANPWDDDARDRLDEALDRGVDVVGGSPDLAADPVETTAAAVAVAHRRGLPIDLHTDQTVDAGQFDLPAYVELVARADLPRAAASHCVSMASQPRDVQRRVAERIAEIGMAVFTMPMSSLFFFGWDSPVAPPRGVTAIHALLEAGVTVAAGGDNVRDAFFPLGGFDPLETAATLALVAHLDPAVAWRMCSDAPRAALGLPPVSVTPGSRADLLVVAGGSIAEAVAVRSDTRTVLRAGRVVARTTSSSALLV